MIICNDISWEPGDRVKSEKPNRVKRGETKTAITANSPAPYTNRIM